MRTRKPWQDSVRTVAEETLHAAAVSGMVIAVARGEESLDYLVIGADAAGTSLDAETLFPVASITKLATALAILRLVAWGDLALDEPLAHYLPDAAAGANATLRLLLCHTRGLPYELRSPSAPYRAGLDWPTLARACLATPPIEQPGTRVNYSNVGYGLLAIVVERVADQPFASALSELVLDPLGIEGYLGVDPPPRSPARVEGELGEHIGTDLEPYNSPFWRSLALPWGGLFTTAAGALGLVRAFADRPPGFLPPALIAEATQDQTGGVGGGIMRGVLEWERCPWGLGPELRGDKAPHFAPSGVSPDSFGHAGASGCLAWTDPALGISWAMLSTRTFETWWDHWGAIGEAILAANASKT